MKVKIKNKVKEDYCPRKIGRKIYRKGWGISELWGATRTNEDTDIALEAYMEEYNRDKYKGENMKVEQINKKEISFKPIELKITIESLDELKELWCRLNISNFQIKELQKGNEYESNCNTDKDNTWRIWQILNEKLKNTEEIQNEK